MTDIEIVHLLSEIDSAIGNTIYQDPAGREGSNAIFGDRLVGQRASQIAVSFGYNIAPRDTSTSTTNTGTVTYDSSASQAVIATGTDPEATAQLQSVNQIRYRSSHDIYCYITTVFTDPEPHSHQRSGFFDSEDGYFFGFNGEMFGATRRKSGVDEFQKPDVDDLTGKDGSKIDIDFTKNNLWRISYGWLGIAPAIFEVWAGVEEGWVVWHVFEKANKIVESEIAAPNLPVTVEARKTRGTKDIQMRVGCFGAGIIAHPDTDPGARPFTESNSVTINADTRTNILSLRSKDQFQGKTNRIRSFLRMMSMSTEGNKPAQFDIVLNGSIGTTSFSDVDAANSVTEFDTTKASVTGGSSLHPVQLQKADSTLIHMPGPLEAAAISWDRGDTLSLTAESTQSSEIRGAMRWGELF